MSSSWSPVSSCTASAGPANARVARARVSEPDDAEPDPVSEHPSSVDRMHELGQSVARGARLAGVDPSTVRRWRSVCALRASKTHRASPACHSRRASGARDEGADRSGRAQPCCARAQSSSKPRASNARRSRWIESERQQTLTRVSVAAAGVIRGLDAMHLCIDGAKSYALVCADAAIPYRTAITLGEHYDAALVVRTLERDIDRHGAPLILRADRARAHDSPIVKKTLEEHQVLMLHGPPRYPCFYGQLERQNREHRAWLAALVDPLGKPMQALLEQMIYCLNTLWPRRSLGWRTAAEAWNARSNIRIDRQGFKKEVQSRARHLERHIDLRAKPADLVERLAIEQTLENLGYLHRQHGGWC